VGDALEAEAVLDALLVAFADGVEVGERVPDVLELAGRDAIGTEDVAVVVAIHREALATRLAVVAPLPVGQRLRTGEVVLAEEEQQIELALHLELALPLVDAQQMTSARRLEQVRRVDGPVGDAARGVQTDEAVVLDDLGELPLIEHSVNGHLRPSP